MSPSHDSLAVLAGLGATSALAIVAVIVVGLIGAEPRRTKPALPTTPRASGRPAAHAPITVGGDQMASLHRIHHIAAVQLRTADRQLRGCRTDESVRTSPRALVWWRGCTRLPLAHLGINSRLNGTILYQLSQRVPPGGCRMLVMGRANGLKLLASATDQVVRGWWDASRQGRIDTVGRALVVARMTGDMRLELRHPGLRICRQGVTDA